MTLPNQLTILRIVLSPVFLFLFLSDEILLNQISVAVFVIAALSDWYDGWLARKFNYITSWGKFWDPLADKILTSTAFIAFAALELIPWWMVIIIVIRDIVITILRVLADKNGYAFVTNYYAKWKTMLQMIFLYYLLILSVAIKTHQLNSLYGNILTKLLDEKLIYFSALAVTLITFHSGIVYLTRNWKIIKQVLKIET